MPTQSATMIEVRDLTYTYQHAKAPAIDHLNFSVEEGEIYGFLGPSGAGKSTTQRLLIHLLEGYGGEARVREKDLSRWSSADYETIGVAFETPNHFSRLTALENLRYFAALYRRSTRSPSALLDLVGLAGDANRRVAEYSKGMKTRLGIARALLHNPEILFLDEPTAGLDPVNAERVKQIIRAERDGGSTIFLTTHDMVAADELCDRVAFLVDGRIRCVGSPRALKLQHGQRAVRVEYDVHGRLSTADYALDSLADNHDFQRVLRSHRIETMHTREATLSDVFVKLTGRGLA